MQFTVIKFDHEEDAHLYLIDPRKLTLNLTIPIPNVKEPSMSQLFLVYSKVDPRMKYIALRVSRTVSILEY